MSVIPLLAVPGGASLRLPMTAAEFAEVGETKATEFYDGLVIVNPPNLAHVRAVRQLARLLEAVEPPGYEVLADWGWQPPGADPNFYRPDLMLANPGAGESDMLHHPPLLVVEVLSPSTADIDAGTKRTTYAAWGAPWYWLVDLSRSHLTLLRLTDSGYAEVQRLTGPGETIGPVSVRVDPSRLATSVGS